MCIVYLLCYYVNKLKKKTTPHRVPNPVHNPSQSVLSLHIVWIVKNRYKRLKNITYSQVANFKHTVHKDISLFKKIFLLRVQEKSNEDAIIIPGVI